LDNDALSSCTRLQVSEQLHTTIGFHAMILQADSSDSAQLTLTVRQTVAHNLRNWTNLYTRIIIDWLKNRGDLQAISLLAWKDRIRLIKPTFKKINYTTFSRA
jgi:hypothetical protein